ncbi:Uncharacterised protein [Mycobacteroides abscessus]|nr:Uncharacterised protein [Mycobacteroides abscessus]
MIKIILFIVLVAGMEINVQLMEFLLIIMIKYGSLQVVHQLQFTVLEVLQNHILEILLVQKEIQ